MLFHQNTHPSLRLAEFIGFFVSLNIFLTLFWILIGSSLDFLHSLGIVFYFLLINFLFLLYFIFQWHTLHGGATFFHGLKQGMGKFGYGLSTLMNTFLLLVVYFIGVGLTSLIAKLFKKRFLQLRQPVTSTYYLPKEQPTTKESYYRQF